MVVFWCQISRIMANITVKNIPDSLYERLKKVAHLRHRSINNEIIRSIEKALGVSESDSDPEELRAMAREFHKKVKDKCKFAVKEV